MKKERFFPLIFRNYMKNLVIFLCENARPPQSCLASHAEIVECFLPLRAQHAPKLPRSRSNTVLGFPETFLYLNAASPFSCRYNIGEFSSTNGGYHMDL